MRPTVRTKFAEHCYLLWVGMNKRQRHPRPIKSISELFGLARSNEERKSWERWLSCLQLKIYVASSEGTMVFCLWVSGLIPRTQGHGSYSSTAGWSYSEVIHIPKGIPGMRVYHNRGIKSISSPRSKEYMKNQLHQDSSVQS